MVWMPENWPADVTVVIDMITVSLNMKDDYYTFDEQSVTLTGERNRKVYKIGDIVKIRVVGANKLLRRIDFELSRWKNES